MNTATLNSSVAPAGELSFHVTRAADADKPITRDRLSSLLRRHSLPNTGNAEVDAYRLRNLKNVLRGLPALALARAVKAPNFLGVVSAVLTRANGEVLDLGIISCRVVTTAGVNKIVAGLNASDTSTFSTFKYHGFGTGATAEAAADTTLVTELTTQYATDNTRPTGSQTTGGSSNIYRTVGTLSPDASCAITEHGIFSAATGGTLLDRSVFSAINLVSGDSLQITYDGTFSAGG